MGTFGVKRASDEYFSPSTIVTAVLDPNHMMIPVPHSPKKLLPGVSHHHIYFHMQAVIMYPNTLPLGLHHLHHLNLYHKQR